MGKLIKFELRKIFVSKFFYVGIVIILLLSGLIGYATSTVLNNPNLSSAIPISKNLYEVVLDGFPSPVGSTLLPVIIVIYSCLDFGNLAIRNIIARGFTRTQVFLAKLFGTVAITVSYMLFSLISLFVSVKLFIPSATFEKPEYFWTQILAYSLAYLVGATFAFALSMMIRKVAGAMAAVLVAPTVVSAILLIITGKVQKFQEINLPKYFFGQFPTLISTGVINDITFAVIGSLIYIAVFVVISYLVWRKAEV